MPTNSHIKTHMKCIHWFIKLSKHSLKSITWNVWRFAFLFVLTDIHWLETLQELSYFGTGHTDFRSSIDVYAAVRFPTNAAAYGICDSHNQCTPLFTVPKGHQSVCSLTWQVNKTQCMKWESMLFCISLFAIINIHHLANCWFQLLLNAYFILFTICTNHVRTIPDWLIKKQTSSLKTGVCLSRKSLASSTITGSSVSSSISCRVCSKKELQYMYSKIHTYLIHRFQCRHILT